MMMIIHSGFWRRIKRITKMAIEFKIVLLIACISLVSYKIHQSMVNQDSSTTLPEKVTETPFQETSVQETTTEDKLYIYNGNKNVGYCVFYNQ